ncbi:MAG: response regulator [Candidatus Omnitrophica bacterium]|jgi:DNA-binding NtrC family response regulator|nr:response regulator [Candidatus Omnitrophota bacterium]MDD4013934.1 response regulator [Candidatus Omnitrophota bacterium]
MENKGHRILIVDDNKDFADVFCDILRANNYKAESCYGGLQAVDLIKRDDFDILFVDIRMPEMDGIETLKEIKKIKPETMVIMMTGYSVDEMVHKAIEEKASEIIYKPFEIEKVLGLIRGI